MLRFLTLSLMLQWVKQSLQDFFFSKPIVLEIVSGTLFYS